MDSLSPLLYMIILHSGQMMDIYYGIGVGATTYYTDENALKVREAAKKYCF